MTTRVCLLGSRGLPAKYGGFETLTAILKTRLEESDLRVEVQVTSRRGSKRGQSFVANRLETVLGTFHSARNLIKGSIVLLVNPANVISALFLKQRGYFVVIHMDGRDDLRVKWSFLTRCLYRCCQRLCVRSRIPLIFDSVVVRSEIGGRHAEKYAVIAYGGCEACEKSRMVWQASNISRNFLTLARAEPENQLVEIVQSVGAMTTSAQLLVVTTTRYKGNYWKDLVDEVNARSSVELVDGIWDKEQLCSMYREFSAVIHGHTVGGTNPSLVLALCHGTPVFAHDNPYNREVAGSLARYWKNEEELTRLLDEFDPASWPYDQAAVDDFNRRYNWEDVVEKYRVVLGLSGSTEISTTN